VLQITVIITNVGVIGQAGGANDDDVQRNDRIEQKGAFQKPLTPGSSALTTHCTWRFHEYLNKMTFIIEFVHSITLLAVNLQLKG